MKLKMFWHEYEFNISIDISLTIMNTIFWLTELQTIDMHTFYWYILNGIHEKTLLLPNVS